MQSLSRMLASSACALALLACPALAFAQDAPQPETTATPAPEQVHPALWKVADEDTTVYLFGTIHILPKAVDWYNGPVADALDHADELVTEVPMDDETAAAAAMMQMGQRSDGKTLRETLKPDLRATYEAQLTKLGIPVAAFDKADAWMAALVLSLIPLQLSGYDLANGIDKQVAAKAIEHGLERDALETPEYQIGLFEALPADVQDSYLGNVLESLPEMTTQIDAMVTAWKEGKPDELARILNSDQDATPQIRQVLLTQRNTNWTKWIAQRLEQPGTVFMAVGAGHLAGEDSVQAQLAKAGIKSTRVQ